MYEIQKAIDTHIAFKKAFDDCINAQNFSDLSNFENLNEELSAFGKWLETKEADYGDISQLKMFHKHFHFFAFKYTEYLKNKKFNESEMLQLALDSSSNKVLRSLEELKSRLGK
jgi:hypothetical protein